MKWRVIPLEENCAFMNMAIDHAISESVSKGADPTIRFYRWNPSAVSIGYFQSLTDEVDVEECKKIDVDVVRRRTGGGAVYHSNKGEITYSVIGPVDMFPKNIIKSYEEICGWITDSLKSIGIESEFKPINDIVTKGKKISGNAQTRRSGVLLQHGTILYDVDVEEMFSLLKVPDEKIRDKMIKAAKDRVTSVLDFKDIEIEELYQTLLKGFTKRKQYKLSGLTDKELKRAEELVREKYSTKEWNFMK